MIHTENRCIQNNRELPGIHLPPLYAKIGDDWDAKPVSSGSLFVDLEQAVVEMMMKMESAEFIEENY